MIITKLNKLTPTQIKNLNKQMWYYDNKQPTKITEWWMKNDESIILLNNKKSILILTGDDGDLTYYFINIQYPLSRF